jgi:hypothetical protein
VAHKLAADIPCHSGGGPVVWWNQYPCVPVIWRGMERFGPHHQVVGMEFPDDVRGGGPVPWQTAQMALAIICSHTFLGTHQKSISHGSQH